jgi:NADH-quinone oxidoreductase subunit M
MTPVFLLSLIVFLPAIATLFIALIPSEQKEAIRWATLAVTAVVMVLVCVLLVPSGGALTFDTTRADLQSAFNYDWIPSFQIDYFMALDGISLPLVVLTAFVSLLAMGASWSITKYVKAYCILFLILET